jgi:Mg2+ and Co2+ transporter CorA
MFAQGEQGLWSYIQQLEEKLKDHIEWRVIAEANSKDLSLRLARVERHNAELADEVGSLRRAIELSGVRPNNGGAAPA